MKYATVGGVRVRVVVIAVCIYIQVDWRDILRDLKERILAH